MLSGEGPPMLDPSEIDCIYLKGAELELSVDYAINSYFSSRVRQRAVHGATTADPHLQKPLVLLLHLLLGPHPAGGTFQLNGD